LRLYEGMFLLDNRQANRDWDGSLEKLKGILSKHGAEIIRCEKWGERKLSYEIGGRRRGTYVLTYFSADGDAVNRIYRECELSDLVLRALILRIKALPFEEKQEEPEAPAERPEPVPAQQQEGQTPAQSAQAPSGPAVSEAAEPAG